MNHQPFDAWIFQDNDFSAEQQQSLQAHLQACPACQERAFAWRSAQQIMRQAEAPVPAPGFSLRFQSRLAERRLMLQRRQSWLMAGLGIGASLVFLGLMTILVLLSFQSPLDWFLTMINHFVDLLTLASTASRVLRTVNATIPLGIAAAISSLLTLAGVLWAASLQKYTQVWSTVE